MVSVFDELELVTKMTISSKTHKEKHQTRTKKYDARMQMVWALNERYDQATHLRAPLERTTIYPNQKTYQGQTYTLHLVPWDRWRWSWIPQDGPPFLIVLAWWRLVDCSPILTMGEPLFSISSQVHCHHNGRQASSMLSSCWSTWTCTSQSWWRSQLDVILHGLYEIFPLMQDHGNTPNPHIELSRRPWVSTQTRNGQCLPYHGITW